MFTYSTLMFNFFACSIISSAFFVIFTKNAIHSILFLILVFINVAGLLLLSKMEFLAMIIIIIYIGAIAILFLFVVMMLNIPVVSKKNQEEIDYIPILGVISLLFFYETFFMLKDVFFFDSSFFNEYSKTGKPKDFLIWVHHMDGITNTQTIGQVLYTYYALILLLAGIILLIALIGAVMLTIKKNPEVTEKQQLYKQISRRASRAVFYISNRK